jgi:hyperosmotically inducible periplasmic protein
MMKILAAAVSIVAFTASLSGAQERENLQIYKDITAAIDRYVYFTVFDDLNATVEDGVVTLTGKVTMPHKKTDIAKAVARIDGVRRVYDQVEVLPVSSFDDDLRYRIARSIYGNQRFWEYASMPNPPIHIIVERSHVTLTGVVQSNVERVLARSIASQFGAFSVTDQLTTESEMRERLETLD